MRRLITCALGLLVVAAACVEETPTGLEPELSYVSGGDHDGPARYRVAIYNITSGQPITPPLAVVHKRALSLFRNGHPASFEVKEIAENGNLDPMVALVSADERVADWSVNFGPTAPPLLPGEMIEFEVESEGGARHLSLVSMLICTNDGFTGLNSIRLPRQIGRTVSLRGRAYDAGTEQNTEAWEDLVPPCAQLTGFGDQGGTGMSNDALAEGHRIRPHRGIHGHADLQYDPHGWHGAIIRVVVERIS